MPTRRKQRLAAYILTGKLEDAVNDIAAHFARSKPVKADKPAWA
jgi:hypothetical protein